MNTRNQIGLCLMAQRIKFRVVKCISSCVLLDRNWK
jgi:hypothetical protein